MTPHPRSPERRSGDPKGLLLLLCVLALVSRALVALSTVAPDRDTANYVEMAKNFRAGEWALALAEVFPPLHPLLWSLVGPLAGPGNDAWWFTGQVLCVLLGVLSVWLLWKAAAIFVTGEETAWVPAIAATWLALGMLPAWNAADALSEGLFMVLLCTWMLAWARERVWWLSILAGLCFLTRPDGAILFGPLLWLYFRANRPVAGRGARRWAHAALVLATGLALPLLYLVARAQALGEFDPLPVGSFMWESSIVSEPSLPKMVSFYFLRVLWFVVQGFDGLGYLAIITVFVALCGVRLLDAEQRQRLMPLVLMALVACLVIPLFKCNRRFWLTWVPILLPLAARPVASWRRFGPRLGMQPRVWVGLLVLFFLLPHVLRLPRERRESLQPDKTIAHHLLDQGAKRGEIASWLQRFLFFAEQAPLPPRRISYDDFLERAASPSCKHAVFELTRGDTTGDLLEEMGYRQVPLAGILGAQGNLHWLQLYSR
jgi:hypothetical protein